MARGTEPIFCLVVSAVLLALVTAQCEDRDDVLGPMMEQQTGQRLTCYETVSKYPDNPCLDPSIAQICCNQCSEDVKIQRWNRFAMIQQSLNSQIGAAARLPLNDGGSMPSLALGTAGLKGLLGTRAVEFALRSGYRALDTACLYGSHQAVGDGIQASGVPRKEIFVVSKVWQTQMGYDLASEAVHQMLNEMKLEYIDLCLIHWPLVSVPGSEKRSFQIVERAGAWRALEKAVDQGKCRHIGVSNYMPQHLRELFDYARIKPAVNQLEFHPYQTDNKTLEICNEHSIIIQAYGSINAKGLLTDPTVVDIAQQVGRKVGQVLLRWAIQQGVMILPKSSNEERILQNAQVWDFELTAEQMSRLSALNQDKRSYGDPHAAPVIDRFRKGR